MITYSIKTQCLWLFLLLLQSLYSQDDFISFWQPQVSVNYRVGDHYSHNFTIANRNYIFRDEEIELNIQQLDLSHFSTWQVSDNQSIGIGLLWRNSKVFEDEKFNEFRLTEQYNIILKPHNLRFGHRIRAEQRFSSLINIYRFRYRFAIDFPLQGSQVDIGETYMLWSIENLWSVSSSLKPIYGLRFRGGLGWQLSMGSTLQFVIEYRLQNFTSFVDHIVLLETALNLRL